MKDAGHLEWATPATLSGRRRPHLWPKPATIVIDENAIPTMPNTQRSLAKIGRYREWPDRTNLKTESASCFSP